MNRVVKIFMERDGMTKEEAVDYWREMRKEVNAMIEENEYDEVEDLLMSEGLEMDYVFDLI